MKNNINDPNENESNKSLKGDKRISKKKIFQVTSASLSLVAIALGGYFIYQNFNTNDNDSDILPQKESNQIIYTDPETNHSITIKEYKAVYGSSKEQRYYFTKINEDGTKDESALKALAAYILKNLSYGQEISELKSINIGFQQLNVSEVNGFYIGTTNEMFIDPGPVVEGFEESGYSINPQVKNSNSLSVEQKIQAIFPTIFHEYGHHISNVYFNSLKKNDVNGVKSVYYNEIKKVENEKNETVEIVEKSSEENYNLSFYNDFVKYTNLGNSEYGKLQYTTRNNDNEDINIGSLTTASSLFDLANKKYQKGTENIFTVNDNPNNKIIGQIKTNGNVNGNLGNPDDARLAYYYSLSEQFTRKLQRISYSSVKKLDDQDQFENNINNAIQFYGLSNGKALNGFGDDILHNFSVSKKNKNPLNQNNSYKLNNYYIADNPYGGTFETKNGQVEVPDQSKNLYESYLKIMGYGSSISQIFSKNTLKAVSASQGAVGENFSDMIKFQGYFDESKKIKGLVFEKKDGKKEMVRINPTESSNFAFKAKSEIFSDRDITPKDTTAFAAALYKSYTTVDYLDLTKYNLKTPIQFWNDENNDNEDKESEYENLPTNPFAKYNRTITNFRSNNDSNQKYYQVNDDFTVSKDY